MVLYVAAAWVSKRGEELCWGSTRRGDEGAEGAGSVPLPRHSLHFQGVPQAQTSPAGATSAR